MMFMLVLRFRRNSRVNEPNCSVIDESMMLKSDIYDGGDVKKSIPIKETF